MNKKEQMGLVRNKLEPLFDKWLKILGLDEYKIDVVYYYNDPVDSSDSAYKISMNVMSDWAYMLATINVYLVNLKSASEYELEEDVVHELIHMCLHEMEHTYREEDYQNHKERVVVKLSRAILRLAYLHDVPNLGEESDG
jgi:hypothetical protein